MRGWEYRSPAVRAADLRTDAHPQSYFADEPRSFPVIRTPGFGGKWMSVLVIENEFTAIEDRPENILQGSSLVFCLFDLSKQFLAFFLRGLTAQ